MRYELRDISSKLLKYTKEEADEFKRKKKNNFKICKKINESLNKDNNTIKRVSGKVIKKLNSLKMFLEKHLIGFICLAIKNKDIKTKINAILINFYFHDYSYLLISNEFT